MPFTAVRADVDAPEQNYHVLQCSRCTTYDFRRVWTGAFFVPTAGGLEVLLVVPVGRTPVRQGQKLTSRVKGRRNPPPPQNDSSSGLSISRSGGAHVRSSREEHCTCSAKVSRSDRRQGNIWWHDVLFRTQTALPSCGVTTLLKSALCGWNGCGMSLVVQRACRRSAARGEIHN